MAFVYVTEYLRQAQDGISRLLPAGMEPSLVVQKIAITAGSVQSAAFNARTTFVSVHTDAICSVAFGPNPTASAASSRLPLDGTQYFGVVPGDKIAVITNT